MGWLVLFAAAAVQDFSGQIRSEVARQECNGAVPGEEIVVCVRRGQQQRRYQVTPPDAPWDPNGSTESVTRERSRWLEGGEVGTSSCSAVGPGGWTGCMLQQFRRDRQQKQGWAG